MAASGSAFRQLAPFTIRVPGIEYYAIPTPGQYDVEAYPYAQPSAVMSCVSAEGTATLCGFSEYTTPSTPPKKYRRQTLSGGWCNNDFSGGCGGPAGNNDRQTYAGTYDYSGVDCAQTNNQTSEYGSSNSIHPCSAVPLSPASAPPANFTPATLEPGFYTLTETPTSRQWDYDPTCHIIVGPAGRSTSGLVTSALSIEDTEADAMARASKTPGTSCLAYLEARGAGDFAFVFATVAYDILCSALLKNRKYRLTYDLVTEDYGGGNAVVTPITLLFQADHTTKHFVGTLEAASGKQVSIQNIAIEQTTAVNSGLSGGGVQTDENHSFREIAPFTPRFVGIEYMAVPVPGNPPQGDSAYPYYP